MSQSSPLAARRKMSSVSANSMSGSASTASEIATISRLSAAPAAPTGPAWRRRPAWSSPPRAVPAGSLSSRSLGPSIRQDRRRGRRPRARRRRRERGSSSHSAPRRTDSADGTGSPRAGRSGSARRPAARCARSRRAGSGTGTAESSASRVRVARPLEELGGGRELDDLAEIHHRDAVADVLDHARGRAR